MTQVPRGAYAPDERPGDTGDRALGVAVVGFGWMGYVHSRAYARLPHHVTDLGPAPELVMVADTDDGRRADARARFGFADSTPDWHDVLGDSRVHAVSVTAPNFLHREIGVAVAEAGRHLWIEKPVGLSLADASAVADAVRANGVQSAVGFNYRNAPAVERAKALIAEGAIGRVTQVEVHLDADYAAHPLGAHTWRFARAHGGNGVLGDLASHGVDLVRYVVGEIEQVVADTGLVIAQRPAVTGVVSHFATGTGELRAVENEDTVAALLRLAGGIRGVLTASRVSVGEQCTYGFTVRGTNGFLTWDFRRMGELVLSTGEDYLDQPQRIEFAGPHDGRLAAFQPAAGIAMSYDDTKVIEAERFVRSIQEKSPHGATIADAVASAAVLEAIERSVTDARWTSVA